jgi:hypothetical protein
MMGLGRQQLRATVPVTDGIECCKACGVMLDGGLLDCLHLCAPCSWVLWLPPTVVAGGL